MNINLSAKTCIGCGACADRCPVNAISIQCDVDGFYKPFISESCVDCGQCVNVCPAINAKKHTITPQFYYGWIMDSVIREKSSSGGVFSALASYILNLGGVIFGATYSDDFKMVEMSSSEEAGMEALRVSKYCQAFSNGMYNKIAEYLKNGRRVMVVGTPCQMAAVRLRFGNNPELLLVDFLCGGAAPVTAFADYVAYLEKIYNSQIKTMNMRDKSSGWHKPRIRIEFENGKIYSRRYQFDYYYHYFYGSSIKCEACLKCQFTNHADSDITIGDFWGYKDAGIKNDGKGMSFIAVNTACGQEAFSNVEGTMQVYPLDARHAQYAYRERKQSKETLSKRIEFMNDMRETSFVTAARKHDFKYGNLGVLIKILIRKVVRK